MRTDKLKTPYNILLWYVDYFDISIDHIFGLTDRKQGKICE